MHRSDGGHSYHISHCTVIRLVQSSLLNLDSRVALESDGKSGFRGQGLQPSFDYTAHHSVIGQHAPSRCAAHIKPILQQHNCGQRVNTSQCTLIAHTRVVWSIP